jgi:hypothetical protein
MENIKEQLTAEETMDFSQELAVSKLLMAKLHFWLIKAYVMQN